MLGLVNFEIYLESPLSLNLCFLYLFLVRGSQVLYVNPDLSSVARCLKSTSGMNLSPANKYLNIINC